MSESHEYRLRDAKFEPVEGVERISHRGLLRTTRTRLHCLTATPQLQDESLEELRYEYYRYSNISVLHHRTTSRIVKRAIRHRARKTTSFLPLPVRVFHETSESVDETDPMYTTNDGDGVTVEVNAQIQCLSARTPDQSLEELRYADYCFDRRGTSIARSSVEQTGQNRDVINTLPTASSSSTTSHQLPKPEAHYCTEHKEDKLELFCHTCQCLICTSCFLGAHYGHNYNQKSEVTKRITQPVEIKLTAVNRELQKLTMYDKRHAGQHADVRTIICKTFQSLHNKLDARKKELLDKVDYMVELNQQSPSSQRVVVEKTGSRLKKVLQQATKSLNDSQNFTRVKETIEQQIDHVKGNPELNCPLGYLDTLPRIKFVSDPNLSTLCKEFGTVYFEEMSPAQCYVKEPTAKLTATVGEKSTIVVQAIDTKGKECKADVVDRMIECVLVSVIAASRVNCEIKPKGTKYHISCTPRTHGRHRLHIKFEFEHIKGSPFPVMAKLPVEKRGTPIKIIDGLKDPWGVAVNQRGEVIVSESGGHCVSIFSPSGEKLRTLGSRGSSRGEFQLPRGIAVDDDDNILVADSYNNRIQKFDHEGNPICLVGTCSEGQTQFSRPVGVAIHPHNKKVYVADRNNHRIQILNPDLTFSSTFGSRGRANGQFNYPWDVTFDNTGDVYVADSLNNCIQVFTAEGTFLRKFGHCGQGDGQLNFPTSVAIDSDNTVYVTEKDNHRVSVFSSEGNFLTSFGTKGKDADQFNSPRGVATNNNSGSVYISDTHNSRVCSFCIL